MTAEDIMSWLPGEQYFLAVQEHLGEFIVENFRETLIKKYEESTIVNRSGDLKSSIENAIVEWNPDTGIISLGIMYYGFFLNFGTLYISARNYFPSDEDYERMLKDFTTNYTKYFPDSNR